VASAFLDLEVFFVVEAELSPAAAVEESAAVSAFLDLDDFLVVEAEVSPVAGVEESEAAFLDLDDFLVVASVEVSSVVVFFFLAFAVVSLWSVD